MKKCRYTLALSLICILFTSCSFDNNTETKNEITRNHLDNFKRLEVDLNNTPNNIDYEINYIDSDAFNEMKEQGEFSNYEDYSQYVEDTNIDQINIDNEEEKQELLGHDVEQDADIIESEMLYVFDKNSTTITLDKLPETLKNDVTFGIIDEIDACASYEAALNYFGNISSMQSSDWITTVMYKDAYTDVFLINGKQYKFIYTFDGLTLYITDKI